MEDRNLRLSFARKAGRRMSLFDDGGLINDILISWGSQILHDRTLRWMTMSFVFGVTRPLIGALITVRVCAIFPFGLKQSLGRLSMPFHPTLLKRRNRWTRFLQTLKESWCPASPIGSIRVFFCVLPGQRSTCFGHR